MKKVAIITGGSRGIGFAIAQKLGLDGYQLAIFSRGDQDHYQEQWDKLDADNITWIYVQGSLDISKDRHRLVDETLKAYGHIDVLVNNAGVAPLERRDLLEMTEESYDRVLDINAKGTMFLTQRVANVMIGQELSGEKRGTIINIGSCSAEVSSSSRAEYCISKAAMSMMTTVFADRLAGEKILVHEVRPGVIATDMTSGVKAKYDALLQEGAFPIQRWGRPEDVANWVSILSSDQVLYTTGNVIDVDGGFHIKRL